MLLKIHHETTFRYTQPVADSYMEVRLRPWSDGDQSCADFQLTTFPMARVRSVRTPFARVEFFNLLAPHETLSLVSEATVMTIPRNPFERIDRRDDDWSLLHTSEVRERYWEYLQPTPDPVVARAADQMIADLRGGEGVAAFLQALNRHIHCSYTYDPGATTVATPLREVLAHRRGVCQDFAHLMLAVARSAGIPCRYVSGYHYSETPPAGDGAMHAWIEAYLPHSGWVGYDPTHGLLVDHQYVRVGWGRDYTDVPPTRGLFRGPQEHTIGVRVRVQEVSAGSGFAAGPRRETGLAMVPER